MSTNSEVFSIHAQPQCALTVYPAYCHGDNFAAVAATALADSNFYYAQNGQQRQYFSGNVVSRVEANIDFSWAHSAPTVGIGRDHFSLRWVGEVLIPVSGNWQFLARSDDGVRLY